MQRPRPLAKSICSKGAAGICPRSPRSLQSPLVCSIRSTPILQVTVVQSSLRIPCATRAVSQQLGPPRPPTPWARAGHPPCPRASTPKKPCQCQGRGPGARRTYGATCGKELGWCHAGLVPCLPWGASIRASLAPGGQAANSQAPAQARGLVPTHRIPPRLGRDQCITYLHPSRSLSRSHPVIHCSRCLRTWPRFQCILGPRTVP